MKKKRQHGSFKKKAKQIIVNHRCPNNNLFIIALLSVVVFLLYELFVRIYDLYRIIPIVDVPSHLLGGLALGTAVFWITSLMNIQKRQRATIMYTIVGAIIWEVFETLEELVIYNPPHLQDVFFWDGFWDIIVTTIGAAAGLIVINYIQNNTTILKREELQALKIKKKN